MEHRRIFISQEGIKSLVQNLVLNLDWSSLIKMLI
jgi:hypothetical protein